MSIELVMSSNHLILCCHLFLLHSVFPNIRVFSDEPVLHIRRPKHWSFSSSISPSNVYLKLISFRIGWFDLLAVQGTLKSLLQHLSSKAPILQCSTFFMAQISYPYMTTGKIITWLHRSLSTKWCLCFLICCVCHSFPFKEQVSFNFVAAVTIHNAFGDQENKFYYYFYFSHIYLSWSDGTECHELNFLNVNF